jgi:hypothetical protein
LALPPACFFLDATWREIAVPFISNSVVIIVKKIIPWAAVAALCLGASTSWAADPRELFLARVPANVSLAVYTGNAAATCQAFQKTTIGQKLSGPVFAPLIEALAKSDRGSLLRMRPIFGFDWSDLAKTNDPGGVIVMPLHDESFGIAWLFAAPKTDEIPPCLAAALEYFKAKGYEAVTDQHPICELTLFTNPKEEDSEWTPVMFRAADFYGIAASPATAAALLEAHGHPSLGMPPELGNQAAAVGTGNPANVSFFLRPFELLELVQARDKALAEQAAEQAKQAGENAEPAATEEEEPKESALEAADRLGLTAVTGIAGSIHFDVAEPCEWSVEAALITKRPYQGAMRSLELRAGPLADLPDWLPADVTGVARWRWDFPLAMQGFGSFYDQANEPGPDGEGLFDDVLDGLRDDPEGVQVDLRKDLFEQLGPEMLQLSDDRGSATPAATADGKPVDTERLLYVVQMRDADRVLDALTRFYKGDKRVTRDKWGAYDVWTVGDNASLFVEGESDSLVTVRGLALGENQLIFSTDVELLKSAVTPANSGGVKLSDDAIWQQLLAWCKSKQTAATALESLVRLDRVAEASYQAAITPPPPKAAQAETSKADAADEEAAAEDAEPPVARLWRLMLFGATKPDADMPFGSAPPFQQLQDALTRGGVVISEATDGWLIQFGAMAGGR